MAHNRKNNHYHYAEKFADKRRKQSMLFMPKKTAIVAALFLLIFGIVSTTFSAYISDNIHPEEREHSILVNVRNTKAQRDIALTGANADLASTGGDLTAPVYYVDTEGWGSANMYFWKSDGYTQNSGMTKMTGTKIYYRNSGWGGYAGFLINKAADDWTNKTSDITGNVSAGTYFKGTSNVQYTNTGDLNSKLNVYTMVSYDGGNSYQYLANSSIYTSASLSEFNYANAKYATTARSGNTQSSNPFTHYPAYGSEYTLTANCPNTVEFRGFYNTSNEHPSSTATKTKTETASKLNNGEYNWYAYYVVPYVNATAIAPSYIATSSSNPSISYTGDGQYAWATITANSITGYTFSNWTYNTGTQTYASGYSSTKSPTKVRTTANCTATANYTINPPTAVSISNKQTTVGTSVDLNPSVTIAASGATAVNTYTISPSSGASVTSTGVFSAAKPGVYTVTLSSKARKTSGSNSITSATAKTGTATVTVLPTKPQWTLTMSGFDPNENLNNGHEYGFDSENPYVVTLGSDFSFTASINTPPNDSNYVYTWYNANDEVLDSVTSTGSSETTKITFGAQTASEATTADIVLPVYVKVTYTGTDGNTIYATGDTITVYYKIKSLIKSFEIPQLQKIYGNPNDAKMDVEYNITNASGYTTTLYASSDNVNFYEAASAAGFLGTQIGASAVYEIDPSADDGPMSKNGPKYFYVNMGKTGANARTDILHTTVDADNADGARQIYFINNTGLDLSDYRVMAFFVDDEGNSYYQTAQDVYKGITGKPQNTRYRVTVPANATQISFGFAKSSRYAVPSYTNNNFDYTMGNSETGKDNVYFIAYTPDMITLDDDHNTINATAKTLVSGYSDTGNDANPFYTLTTSYVAFVSAD
ncbi:MAG: hypothetical protein IJV48_07055 [Ruminococcus sp.]|nr:hypothetical protein [Ruminococcus sp.]